MHNRWLPFLTIGFLSIIVFIFFWYRNQPVNIPEPTLGQDIAAVEEPTITFVNPQKGAEEPTVTIIEYGDFECGPCKTLATSLDVVARTYPDDVRIVWKNLPNESIHPLAIPAAIAAHCADRQGAFWTFHDAVFERQSFLTETNIASIAEEIGLDTDQFNACTESQDTLPLIQKDFEEGLGLGLTSTPSLYINGELIIGAITTQELLDRVEDELAR